MFIAIISFIAGSLFILILNFRLIPKYLNNPRLRIKQFYYKIRESVNGIRFEYILLNEGKNPVEKYYVFILDKKIDEGGFLDSGKKTPFEKTYLEFTDDEKKQLTNEQQSNTVTIFYRDHYRNWYYSECAYVYKTGISEPKNISFAKSIYLWDWLRRFKKYKYMKKIA